MRTTLACTLAFIACAGGSPAVAQSKPDFTGNWLSTTSPGRQLTIAQNAERITVTSLAESFDYRLDGAETRVTRPTLNGEPWTYASVARWVTNGLTVITTITREVEPKWKWDDMAVYSLDGESGELVVVSVNAVKRMGPFMSVTTERYRKR